MPSGSYKQTTLRFDNLVFNKQIKSLYNYQHENN
jgi:hypothetical protein